MQVRRLWQRPGVDFRDRADEAELPLRTRARDAPQKLDVEALVDDAEITESRPRETFDLEVRNCGVLRTCEMRAVDTAWE